LVNYHIDNLLSSALQFLPMILTVANLKGGVGKTNLAVNLACALAGYLVDADPQGTAWVWLSKGQLPIQGRHLPLDSGQIKAWLRELDRIETRPLVIDCPPALSNATRASLFISDLVVIPVSPSGADIWATKSVLELLSEVRADRKGLPASLLVPSRVDRRTSAGRELPEVLKAFQEPVGPVVHQLTGFVDSFSSGQWIGDFAPLSPAHQEILDLTEVIKK
jgi:chromosome partitioning protein